MCNHNDVTQGQCSSVGAVRRWVRLAHAAREIGMLHIPRIGLFFGPSIDPFWVQVLEAIYQRAHDLELDLIAIDSDLPPLPSGEEETALYEELLAQDLDVVIGWGFPQDLARRVLASGVPIVHLNETEIRHPLSVSPQGLYDIARLIGAFLVEKLH